MTMPSIGQKSGYLEVKVPSKARGKGIKAWKAWKRRWVVLNGLTNMATHTPMVTIDMYLNESREGHQLERSTIYLENVVTIIRTHSKSHLYAFGVEAQETILYISGRSEGDSQSWIAALRAILWPPTSRPTLELSIGSIFNVSIIESLSSMVSRNLMLSTVGYLITLPSVILLASLSTGCILVEWPWSCVEQVLLVESPAPEDQEKVMFVEIASGLPTSGSYYFFSENCLELHAKLTARMNLSDSDKDLQDSEYLTSLAAESSLITQCKLGIQISAELLSTKSTISDDEFDTSEILTPQCGSGKRDIELHQDKPETYGVEFRRRQWSLKRGSTSFSTDDIPIRVLRLSSMSSQSHTMMLPDRRKSVSDSDLSKRNSGYERASQQSMEKFLASGTSAQMEGVCHEMSDSGDRVVTDKMNSKLLSVAQVHQRPLSVYSSTSQVSRDSGVMMSQFEESNSDGKSTMGDDSRNEADDSVVNYGIGDEITKDVQQITNLSDSMETGQYQRRSSVMIEDSKELLHGQNNSQRMSSSSDTSLYSEIDNISGNQKGEDPLYEDLDKFRKDIHKLLGIAANEAPQKSPCGTLQREAPPPLPPRKYKGMTAMGPAKHKDVMKYLGVDARYGSLDKLSATNQNAQVNCTNSKRKDIYRYLGIPSMAASQPAGLNNPELMYDCPASTRQRKNSVGETHNPNRRASKTYVRVQSLANPPVLPGKTDTLRKKKKKLSFLKRKSSIVKKNSEGPASNSTYISFESVTSDNWDDICASHQALDASLPELNNHIVQEQDKESDEIPELRNVGYEAGQICIQSPFCSDTKKNPIEDMLQISASLPDVLDMSQEQKQCIMNEQYAVPANCRNSIISLLSANEQKIEEMAAQPYYVNLDDLKPALNSIQEVDNSLAEHPDEVNAELEYRPPVEFSNQDIEVLDETDDTLIEENFCAGPIEVLDDELSDASVESNYMNMTGTILRRPKQDAECLGDDQFLQDPARTSEYYVEVDSLLQQEGCDENETITAEQDKTS